MPEEQRRESDNSAMYVALSGMSVDVSKVIMMIDEMLISLKMEQSEDDSMKS